MFIHSKGVFLCRYWNFRDIHIFVDLRVFQNFFNFGWITNEQIISFPLLGPGAWNIFYLQLPPWFFITDKILCSALLITLMAKNAVVNAKWTKKSQVHLRYLMLANSCKNHSIYACTNCYLLLTRIQNNIRKSVRTRFGIQNPSFNLQKKLSMLRFQAKDIWQKWKITKRIINFTRVVK